MHVRFSRRSGGLRLLWLCVSVKMRNRIRCISLLRHRVHMSLHSYADILLILNFANPV